MSGAMKLSMNGPPPGQRPRARDTWEVADLLDLDEVALLGISGGGPYALAAASSSPSRVRAVGVVAGVGQRPVVEPAAVAAFHADLERTIGPLLALGDAAMVEAFFANVPAGPSRRDGDPGYRVLWARDLREALRSYDGFVRDNLSWGDPWDVDPSSVRSRCLLWYGESDVMVPASDGRGSRTSCRVPSSPSSPARGTGR